MLFIIRDYSLSLHKCHKYYSHCCTALLLYIFHIQWSTSKKTENTSTGLNTAVVFLIKSTFSSAHLISISIKMIVEFCGETFTKKHNVCLVLSATTSPQVTYCLDTQVSFSYLIIYINTTQYNTSELTASGLRSSEGSVKAAGQLYCVLIIYSLLLVLSGYQSLETCNTLDTTLWTVLFIGSSDIQHCQPLF